MRLFWVPLDVMIRAAGARSDLGRGPGAGRSMGVPPDGGRRAADRRPFFASVRRFHAHGRPGTRTEARKRPTEAARDARRPCSPTARSAQKPVHLRQAHNLREQGQPSGRRARTTEARQRRGSRSQGAASARQGRPRRRGAGRKGACAGPRPPKQQPFPRGTKPEAGERRKKRRGPAPAPAGPPPPAGPDQERAPLTILRTQPRTETGCCYTVGGLPQPRSSGGAQPDPAGANQRPSQRPGAGRPPNMARGPARAGPETRGRVNSASAPRPRPRAPGTGANQGRARRGGPRPRGARDD